MTGFFEVSEGVRSMGRLQIFIGTLTGAAIAIFGAVTKQEYLVYAGIGLIVGESGMKKFQRKGETK